MVIATLLLASLVTLHLEKEKGDDSRRPPIHTKTTNYI